VKRAQQAVKILPARQAVRPHLRTRVRYSKLPFRYLVRQYGCDLCYTPMIVASSFLCSDKARDNEFVTGPGDRPLIVQFASNDPAEFAACVRLVEPHCDGVDLNCGCPQRWANQQNLGVCLCSQPQLLAEMFTAARAALRCPNKFALSAKIRLCPDMRDTERLCLTLDKAGADWITVHCRTPTQRHEPADWEALARLRSILPTRIALVANGDVFNLLDADRLHSLTGCLGVMSARGLIRNPAMFSPERPLTTPNECVRRFLWLSLSLGLPYPVFHYHLVHMLEDRLSRAEAHFFNYLTSVAAVIDFVNRWVLNAHNGDCGNDD
uniref:tRNA-dihydrouridine synthase n=1 Tax=Macrostomum lignano TaxID=282301 RepID=A0A1I8GWF9_9PLAT